ncbi:hypothetical protein EMPS_00583 [Entomortierella parvispora]|uniref:Phytocyanin domain-containing protein n=1 Tax=Entomortierella parvispora TaxID=205924 RepID=A0A9P3H1Z5_9FUNG|nr:hypothetical protein EMPS_00583 [Entomortierella parvispora]
MRFSLLTLAALIVPALAAKTWDVNVVNGLFSPQVLNIAPGDSVRWPNNDGANHAIVETNAGARSCNNKAGGFNSGTKTKGQAYQRSFPKATTVNYKDGVGANCIKGATGTIIVGSSGTSGSSGSSTWTTSPTKTAAPITKPSNGASVLSTQKSIVLGAACVVGALIL